MSFCWTDPRGRAIVAVLVGAWALAGMEARPVNPSAPAAPAGTLQQRYTREFLIERMLPAAAWKPFPPAADRAAWDALVSHPLNQERRAFLVARAEQLVGTPWPALPATLYMQYARDGNRANYEQPYFERRAGLATLVLAECLEHRGRFLDEIANGLWAITEEATWCLPAHAARLPNDVLHRQDLESVDLFAAETAMTLATARYLLRAELEALSPALADRVRREVLRRVVDPVATSDAFGSAWWLDGRNNWSPWCASNVLGAAMLSLDLAAPLADLGVKLMGVADRFVAAYGDDGGCDEGPGYWDQAGGALLVFLELMRSRTGGAVDIYDQPKIAAMGRFIVRAHIGGPWFLNYSDADARTNPGAGKVYRFGERIGSEPMKNLALLSMRRWDPSGPVSPPVQISGVGQALLGPLMAMFWIPADARPAPTPLEPTVWLPDVQMLAVRESSDPQGGGLYLAVRGGHNAESHNHNDVGHFVVYLDGQPGIIDVGRETYTAQTFGGGRYDLWFTRGSAHNAPLVGGVEQAEGRERRATGVTFSEEGSTVRLVMSLEQAYPQSAGLVSLRRQVEFERTPAARVRVADRFTLARPAVLSVPFYAARPAERLGPGRLAVNCTPRRLIVEYPAETLDVSVEEVALADPILRANWGPTLSRILFRLTKANTAGRYEFRLRAEEAKGR